MTNSQKFCSFFNKNNLCNIQKKFQKNSNFPYFGSKQLSSCLLSCPNIENFFLTDNEQFKIIDDQKN